MRRPSGNANSGAGVRPAGASGIALNYKTIHAERDAVSGPLDVEWGIARIRERKLRHTKGA